MIANDDNETAINIPLGPALIAWAVLVSVGGMAALAVAAVHWFIVPIPFW